MRRAQILIAVLALAAIASAQIGVNGYGCSKSTDGQTHCVWPLTKLVVPAIPAAGPFTLQLLVAPDQYMPQPPMVWVALGALPPGLTLTAAGQLVGNPPRGGWNFDVVAIGTADGKQAFAQVRTPSGGPSTQAKRGVAMWEVVKYTKRGEQLLTKKPVTYPEALEVYLDAAKKSPTTRIAVRKAA